MMAWQDRRLIPACFPVNERTPVRDSVCSRETFVVCWFRILEVENAPAAFAQRSDCLSATAEVARLQHCSSADAGLWHRSYDRDFFHSRVCHFAATAVSGLWQ